MARRRKLGTTYTRSPSQEIGEWMGDNTTRIIFGIVWSIGFLVVLFVLVSVLKLLGTEIAGWWDPEETTAISLYNHPMCLPIKVIGIIGCFIYVFRDRLSKR